MEPAQIEQMRQMSAGPGGAAPKEREDNPNTLAALAARLVNDDATLVVAELVAHTQSDSLKAAAADVLLAMAQTVDGRGKMVQQGGWKAALGLALSEDAAVAQQARVMRWRSAMAGEAAWERLCREMLCTAVRGQGAKATCGGSLGQGFGSSRLPMLPVFAWRGLAKAGGRDASMCHYARSLHFGLQKRARNCTLVLLDACSAAAAVRMARNDALSKE